MAIDLNNSAPIDPTDPQFATMLENLQGNILKGHGRDHTVHIFVEFDCDAAAVREALTSLAGEVVTSAAQQQIESEQFKAFGIPGAMFGNVFLTAKGYRAVGFSEAQLDAAFPETP